MTKKVKKETEEIQQKSNTNGHSEINLIDICLSLEKTVSKLTASYTCVMHELEQIKLKMNAQPDFTLNALGKLLFKTTK